MLLIEEVANILRCSTQDVQAEIESGKLKAFQVSGQLRVLESELQRFVSGTSTFQAQESSTEQKGAGMSPRAYAPLFQGLRTTFSCVFEGFSRELSSNYIINTNCNALYSPITYRKVATM